MNENPQSNIVWEDRLTWFKSSPEYRALDRIDGEPMEFEWNIFPVFSTLQLCSKVQESLSRLSVEPEKFTGRLIFMSIVNDTHGDLRTKQRMRIKCSIRFSLCEKIFNRTMVTFLGPGSEKKWSSIHEDNPQGEWERIAQQIMLTFAESKHPVFRSTSPLSRGVLKSRGGGKLSIHYCADLGTIETVFRTIVCVDQLSMYGEVADMCEELDSSHDRTGRLVLAGQSDPLFVPTSVMKTLTTSTDDPAQEYLLQKFQERVERLSQQNRVIKICTDAGFLATVDVGQYFMTTDTERILTIYRISGLS